MWRFIFSAAAAVAAATNACLPRGNIARALLPLVVQPSTTLVPPGVRAVEATNPSNDSAKNKRARKQQKIDMMHGNATRSQ